MNSLIEKGRIEKRSFNGGGVGGLIEVLRYFTVLCYGLLSIFTHTVCTFICNVCGTLLDFYFQYLKSQNIITYMFI